MTASDLSEVWDAWKVGLKRHSCGSAVVMVYEPGATLIRCIGCRDFVFGVPDWSPRECNEAWNAHSPG